MTKELAGKILGDLYDAQYDVNVAQTAVRLEVTHDLEFNDFYCDLEEAHKELDKIVKRLEPYDK